MMSGFTRDTQRYGDKLVYEALGSKWRRYHDTHGAAAPPRDGLSAISDLTELFDLDRRGPD